MSAETFEEQLSRVDLMASGDSQWYLSENDRAALQAVIREMRILARAYLINRHASFEEAATIALEQRCERGTPWDLACVAIAEKIREKGAN